MANFGPVMQGKYL